MDGVGTLTVATDTRRSHWKTDELANEIVTAKMAEGIVAHPLDVVRLIMAGAQVSGWRVTWMREQGLDPDEWADVEYGRKTVRIQ